MSEIALGGIWLGIFNYPDELPAASFRATITDADGRLGGTIEEVDTIEVVGRPLHAAIDGTRDGRSVRFAKFYAPASGAYDTVGYRGVVNAEGDEIVGEWQVPGAWSGSFIMTRPRTAEIEAERQDAAER